MTRLRLCGLVLSGALGVFFGCGVKDGKSGSIVPGSLNVGEGPCTKNTDCLSGEVGATFCLDVADGMEPSTYCTRECNAVDGCFAAGYFCDKETFADRKVKVCRRLPKGSSMSQPGQPVAVPPPTAPPRLLCDGTQSGSCPNGLICATFMGVTDCTLPCTKESDCTFTFPGVTIDMHTCQPDQTPGVTRNACLPDLTCFESTASVDRCFKTGLPNTGGTPGSPCTKNEDCTSGICQMLGILKICQ